ncbi:MAG: hypothetical protein GX557_16195, partial [Chloroflexi bacterium]|nr:hypothetical protein [Chloroflexota bacterium]
MATSADGTTRLEHLAERLRDGGGRLTPQRIAIVRALLVSEHPTVDEL